ncbi:MAG: SBBP repeat-containing protein [bacterium]|nr:SBBP repeat-containing protein [bacterium]
MYLRSSLVSIFMLCLLSATIIYAGNSSPISAVMSGGDDLRVTSSASSMPTAFTKNMGQWPDSILFRADAGGATMWFTKDGIYYQFSRHIPLPQSSEGALAAGLGPRQIDPADQLHQERDSVESIMLKAQFVGASPDAQVVGLDELEYKCNYFIGDERSNWHTDVPNFSGITYQQLYPGVDASFGARDGKMECRLTAATESSLAQVKTEYRGALSVTNESDGMATLQTTFGEMRFAGVLPVTESEMRGAMKTSAEAATGTWVLVYGTYLGSSAEDKGYGIAVDADGCAYVTGNTSSAGFPVLDPYQTHQGSSDIFVTKLNPAGDGLVFSTFIGGDSADGGNDVALDTEGNAYVTGTTYSPDFPTVNPFQTLQGATDAFVVKLSAAGNSLLFGTCLGGSIYDFSIRDIEDGTGIDVDANGNCYVIGSTNCVDFPLQNPLKAAKTGNFDVFVAKLAVDGGSLVYSTYFGGGDSEYGHAIAVSDAGNAYVTGDTKSTDFPIQNAIQMTYGGGEDAFVARFSGDGSSLIYSTYLGGLYWDEANDIAVDSGGSAYVVGKTGGEGFPLANPLQPQTGDESYFDMFLTKFSADGTSLYFSTYIGGPRHDFANSVALDSAGNIYIAGYHDTGLWPRPGSSSQPQSYTNDIMVVAVSSGGESLLYTGYLLPQSGSDAWEEAYAIAADGDGNTYVTGMTTWGGKLPFPDPYQPYQGNADAFVAKLAGPSADRDSDGLLDINDNCPLIANPGQEDTNNDGIGDACCCIGTTGNPSGSISQTPDLLDLTFVIAYLILTPSYPLPCPAEANTDGSGGVDLSDLSVLIAYLTQTGSPELAPCR